MMIDMKVSVKRGDMIDSYNNWNKPMKIAVKGVGNVANSFQLAPDIRAMIPTGITLEDPATIYIDQEVALKKSLELVTAVQFAKENEEIVLLIRNTSDSLVTIADGEVLARAIIEKNAN